jgi:hypothetical protein
MFSFWVLTCLGIRFLAFLIWLYKSIRLCIRLLYHHIKKAKNHYSQRTLSSKNMPNLRFWVDTNVNLDYFCMLFQYDNIFSFWVWFLAFLYKARYFNDWFNTKCFFVLHIYKTISKSIQESEIQMLNGIYGGMALTRGLGTWANWCIVFTVQWRTVVRT